MSVVNCYEVKRERRRKRNESTRKEGVSVKEVNGERATVMSAWKLCGRSCWIVLVYGRLLWSQVWRVKGIVNEWFCYEGAPLNQNYYIFLLPITFPLILFLSLALLIQDFH